MLARRSAIVAALTTAVAAAAIAVPAGAQARPAVTPTDAASTRFQLELENTMISNFSLGASNPQKGIIAILIG